MKSRKSTYMHREDGWMTRYRLYGEDSPCMNWFRNHPMLPSTEWVQTDVDTILHRYKTEIDGIGSRRLQLFMHLEIKTRNGDLTASQRDTLWKTHRFLTRGNGTIVEGDQTWHHFGVSILQLSGTTPDDSDVIWWGRFETDGTGIKRRISPSKLLDVIHFDCHPNNFEPMVARRHHKTVVLTIKEQLPLGFEIERDILKRS